MDGIEMTFFYATMAAVGIGVCALILLALNALAALAFSHYAIRVFNTAVNWRAVALWDANGRPEWKLGPDGVYRFVPQKGRFEWPLRKHGHDSKESEGE